MEYTLRNTDIFDLTLAEKFDAVILSEINEFDEKKVYELIASFHVDLLKDLSRFERFILPDSDKINKRNKKNEKDKLYDVLSFQLNQLEGVLLKHNIEFYSTAIRGELLESTQVIKIQIVEDMSEPITTSNGKKRQRTKVSSVIPSMIYTENLVAKLVSERLNELYYKFFNIIKSKKIMSEILGIDITDDDNLLFQTFVKEYGDLWLTTSVKEKELLDKFKNKAIEVLEKYVAE